MAFLNIAQALKLAALGCSFLAGVELIKPGSTQSRKVLLFTLMDIAYLVSCAGTCSAFILEIYYALCNETAGISWTEKQIFDVVFILLFCVTIVLLCVIFIQQRLSGACAPGIICIVHGMILSTMISDILEAIEYEHSYRLSESIFRIHSAKNGTVLICSTFMAFGNFLLSGFAYLPQDKWSPKRKKRQDLDSCSPFSKVVVSIVYKHIRNTLFRSRVVIEDIPRLARRFRCSPRRENDCQKFIKKTQSISTPYRFYCLVLRHTWTELFWSSALTLLYYSSLLLRIPLFAGLLAGASDFSFYQSITLLSVSCIAECLVSSMQAYSIVQNQLKAQLLLQTAVFKKVTCLSATAISENPAGHVTSLLAADSWQVAVSIYYLPNTLMGVLCVLIALGVLGVRMGFTPACACFLWLVVIASASLSMEPLLDKYCNILYKYRDERLKKFNDFLSVFRLVKMSALEDVFRTKLLELRLKEVGQAYRVNVLDSLLETLISASTSVMIILAFAIVTFMNPEKIFSPATIYSCMYILTLMDAFTTTMAHAVRLKSPVFRSCRRLMSFFADEEWNAAATESTGVCEAATGEVTLSDCSFAWAKEGSKVDLPVLQNISVKVSNGSIVGIVGSVGSGKSSLLSAVSGDMRRLRGSAAIRGTLGVVCQRPHVFNMTIRDNITFGSKVDESYYWKVLEACQMIPDIERLPAGDLAEAGEKGEMLSGGQKQRVALARAVYSRSDIYLLDDPTSSQDARVARSILERVIGPHGLLGTKTRLFVTNNTWLPFSPDQWVLMHDRTAVLFEDLNQLKQHSGAPTELFKEPNGKRVGQIEPKERKDDAQTVTDKEAVRVVKEEGLSSNKGVLEICIAYIKYSGPCTVLALLCFVSSAAFTAGQLVCIRAWAALKTHENNMSHSSRDIIAWLALTCIGDVLSRLFGGILLARGTRHCSLSLHDNMLGHVANSPLSFFDATPRGRLLNRFSVDLEMNDSRAFVALKQLYQTMLGVVARLAVMGTQALIVFALACGAEIVLVFILRHVVAAITLGRQYESTRLSRLLQHLAETLDSVGMIRCYRVMDKFRARFRRLMNDYIEAFNAFVLSYSFTRLIFTCFGVLVIFLAVVLVVVPNQGDQESAATVGLSLLSALTVPFAMAGVFMVLFWGVLGFVALERALEYTDLPIEEDTLRGIESPSDQVNMMNPRIFLEPYDGLWPSQGVVKFEHFSASYRPGVVEDTLKDICFVANAGEKVAVVGRTGAGKSSLVLALLRMIQRTSGAITIDGTDICDVSLKRLRSAIAIIPQDPSLFCGTLRENLDPQGGKPDSELWDALQKVGLEEFTRSSSGGLSFLIAEKAENLSAGQRQLVSFARALLRGTKILVLDEATSQMDQETDRRVQTTLRESFSHCTLITIAHRIDTILDYDRVVVMGDGRVIECGRIHDLLADRGSTFHSMAVGAGIPLE
ncbi:multidrug resistance-associated protein 1-like [Dermacentor silvarum]|uniref:multidrug resistance-associated protein 1-like n=1 Tax=Dermacentor silvarum TaxID=543639 RepID=UPI002100FF09|nr:multidrug resistance-associated protein 1-like [Dermacentor silvarum]